MIFPLIFLVAGSWVVNSTFKNTGSKRSWESSRKKYSDHWIKECRAGRTKDHVTSTTYKDVRFNR